ncbi:MAG: NfeD family protein [Chitinophagaceae bacterium]
MKRSFLYFIFLLMPLSLIAQTVVSINVNGTINPTSADFIHNSIQKAKSENAQCLIIQLNTPGGLLQSTRQIVSDILQSPVPVIVYVSPSGAHAGSAGLFITLAAHIAAMAPETNLGAAHPVELQGQMDTIMNEKATNDAAAFIRTIAEKRNRNLQWAEEAVRKSVAITENEALKLNVIDLIAPNEQELLNEVDGKNIAVNSRTITLHTKGARIELVEMSAFEKMLDVISDPNIAYILMLLGIFGIIFELYNPGAIFPGIVGVISLILAFYTMQTLPINYAGLALIIFGIILYLLEIKIVSHGLLAIGGTVSVLFGSMMLIHANSSLEFVSISKAVIISSTIITALFFVFIIGLGLKAQRLKPVTGISGMIGEECESLNALNPEGTVKLHGEIWNAESVSGNISKGEKVRVKAIKDLKLYVEKLIE